MNLPELLHTLDELRVDLWVEGDLLRFRMPEKAMDKSLLAELRRHKQELINHLRQSQYSPSAEAGRLEPLSLGQQALYFLHAIAPTSPAYNVAAAFRITSPVDIAVMRQCFQILVSRHESLRTTFVTAEGQPRCQVHPQAEVDFRQESVAGWDDTQIRDAVQHEYELPFDLTQGPLMRIRLFTRDERDHVFLMTLHHIIFDAWSLWLVQDEFQQLYRKRLLGETTVLPSVATCYADFVRAQTELQRSERGEQLWQFWSQRLRGTVAAPELPLDYPRPDRPSQRGATHKFRIPPDLSRRLRELAKSHGATPFVTLLAIFKTLLFRYSGQNDLTVGTTTSGRTGGDYRHVVGYFVNTLVVRSDVVNSMSFVSLLAHVRQRTLEAIEHQEYPFPLLVDRLNPRRDTGRLPICSVMFGLQKPQQFSQASHLFDAEAGTADWGGLEVIAYDLPQQEGQFDITLEVFEATDSFLLALKYDLDLFRPETAERMAQHYVRLAESVVENPDRALFEYELVPDSEIALLAQLSSSAAAPIPSHLRVHESFEAQVAMTPDRIAVADDEQTLTYNELNRRANQLARCLQKLGVRPGDLVACQPGRGIATAVSLLASLKAGAAYVPLDPYWPRERLERVLAICSARVLLTRSRFHASDACVHRPVAPGVVTSVVSLDAMQSALDVEEATNLGVDVDIESSAYVLFTSGSTGQPKGVCVPHQAIARHVSSMRAVYEMTAQDRVLQFSQSTFDPSLEQMLVPWSVGASTWMRGEELWAPVEFWERVRTRKLTVINVPPAYFRHLTEAFTPPAPPCLRLVIVGGDVFPSETLSTWRNTGVRLLNAYGPTEAVITATTHDVTNAEWSFQRVPIGRTKPGMSAYVLDECGRVAPLGVPGELFLGGPQLASGYLRDPQLTADRFVPDPRGSEPGARMYRTGDCARWNPQGELEFLGRHDRQIKIHGFRVELGEVECALNSHPGVRESFVATRKDNVGETYLVAWLGVTDISRLTIDDVRTHLRERVPGYMVPRQFALLPQLPWNSSGKIDTQALPDLQLESSPEHRYVAPRTELERTLTQVWSQVLEVERVGTDDNFFDLGGSSLSSLRIIALLQESGLELAGEAIKPELLFEYPTVGQLATYWASLTEVPSVGG
jgi:amino acid adenylation domain-containing protein